MSNFFSQLRFFPEHKLVVWHPEGVLDLGLATQMVDFLTFQEKVLDEPFHRFASLEGISELHLKVAEVNDLAARRRATYGNGPPVMSALLATSPGAFGAAWLFATLMENSPIQVRVFREIEPIAQWLGVAVQVLQPE